jgi:hypothetical protein
VAPKLHFSLTSMHVENSWCDQVSTAWIFASWIFHHRSCADGLHLLISGGGSDFCSSEAAACCRTSTHPVAVFEVLAFVGCYLVHKSCIQVRLGLVDLIVIKRLSGSVGNRAAKQVLLQIAGLARRDELVGESRVEAAVFLVAIMKATVAASASPPSTRFRIWFGHGPVLHA